MTNQEFSNEFDVLYNNIRSNLAPGIDEYEKSVILTQAQEGLIIDLYSGRLGDSFESSEEVRSYLRSLIKVYNTNTKLPQMKGVTDNSVFFELPEDVWFILYESVNFNTTECKSINVVIPVTQDEVYKTLNSPFRGPTKKRVLRLDYGNNIVELLSSYDIDNYTVKYLARPQPIILQDLEAGLSINGESKQSECKLNQNLHRAILERAIKIASSISNQTQ